MEEEKPLMGEQSTNSDPYAADSDFCCCLCCECCGCRGIRERSKNKDICCMPLQVYIWLIVALTYIITLLFTVLTILLFFNEYVETYYAIFMVLFILPLFVACGLNWWYCSNRTKKGR